MTATSRGEITPFPLRNRSGGQGATISKSRLVPPRLPIGLVGADKPGDWMERVLASDITLVCAPPAYGKTIFAARLYHEMYDAGFCAAWVSCSTLDGAAATAHIVHGLLIAIGEDGASISADRAGLGPIELANRIYDHEEPLLLCLDGVDTLDSETGIDFLDQLVCNCPTNLHLLLTSRTRTAAIRDWGERRQSEQLIGPAALALSNAELADYFAAGGVVLGDARARLLNTALAGWWGGARLAREALSVACAPAGETDWVQQCAEWSAAPFDNLLRRLSDAEQSFLLRCSVVPIFSSALASVLAGVPDDEADRLLTGLIAQGCFIEQLPGAFGRSRFLPAFRHYLLTRLALRDPAAVHELRRRACAWHVSRDEPLAAIEIGLFGEDHELLADLVGQHGMVVLGQAGPILLSRALGRLEPDRVAQDGRLARLLQRIAALDDISPCASRALDARLLPLAEARAAAGAGDHVRAQALLAPLMRQARETGLGYFEARALLAVADAHRALGHPADAERVLRDGRGRLIEGLTARSDAALLVSVALADSLYRQNDLAGIAALVDDFLPFLAEVGDSETVLRGYRVAIRLAAAQGRIDEAMGLIERVEEVAQIRHWLPFSALAAVERVRIRAPLVMSAEDILPIEDEEEAVADATHPRARAFALLSEAHAYDAIHRLDRARLTIVADRLLRLAEHLNDVELRVIGTLLHILPQLSGRCDRMVEIDTAKFLNHAAGMGFVRPIIDLLQITGVRTSQDFNSAGYSAGTFLGLLRLIPPPDTEPNASSGESAAAPAFSFLSAREMEVVVALGSGETNKMIARKLGLTPETIKWHMKSLMRKLRASTRDEVVSNARMLGFMFEVREDL